MKIVGVRKFDSKNGKKCCVVSVIRPYTGFEESGSTVVNGEAVENVWIPASCSDKITGKDVGKTLVIEATYANGKSYVSDVTVA